MRTANIRGRNCLIRVEGELTPTELLLMTPPLLDRAAMKGNQEEDKCRDSRRDVGEIKASPFWGKPIRGERRRSAKSPQEFMAPMHLLLRNLT